MMCSTVHQAVDPMVNMNTVQSFAGSLVNIAAELYIEGDEEVLSMYDVAYTLLSKPSNSSCKIAAQHIQEGSLKLLSRVGGKEKAISVADHPDLYQEDECDVGPRLLIRPVRLDSTCPLDNEQVFIESVLMFNRGIALHSKAFYREALQHYDFAASAAQNFLRITADPSDRLLEMAMRSHNNMAQIYYLKGEEFASLAHFEASLVFAKQLSNTTRSFRLEHATVLSNWCRVNWMGGDISDNLYNGVRDVLRIRSSMLSWSHVDVAAAHFNVAVAEYARHRSHQAIAHLLQYLHVAAYRGKASDNDLDPIPALIYLLLIQNEDKDDSISQELVRGLRTLQDKRQDQGPNSTEVASVLNFIGTLLFHKHDLDNALLFFQEELRLEERLSDSRDCRDDISVSVTCNNIARILQELGKLHDAMYYYQRALESEYGDVSLNWEWTGAKQSFSPHTPCGDSASSAANLYSTVWYNLGLIHDKLGSYRDATSAFQMSLELRKTMLGRDHPDIACLLYNIGVLQMEQQLLNEASTSFREALRIRRVGSAGQLNDRHVRKTLEKLASLHKAKGNIDGALEALRQVLRIQEASTDYNATCRLKDMGITLRSLAELHHAMGDLPSACALAQQSVQNLGSLDLGPSRCTEQNFIDHLEHLVSSYLLAGSIYHEMSEPGQAYATFATAAQLLAGVDCSVRANLQALREVTCMLATVHGAPEA